MMPIAVFLFLSYSSKYRYFSDDHSRVMLVGEDSDYINANYIDVSESQMECGIYHFVNCGSINQDMKLLLQTNIYF